MFFLFSDFPFPMPSPAPDISLFMLKIAINNQKMARWKLYHEKHPLHVPGASPYYNTPPCCNTVCVSRESGKSCCANSHHLSKAIKCLENAVAITDQGLSN